MVDKQEVDLTLEEDFDIDSIEDLPGFVQLPTGGYVLFCEKGIEEKEFEDTQIKGKMNKRFTMNWKLESIEELHENALEEGEAPPAIGDVQSFMYNKDKQGVAFMKPLLNPVSDHFETKQFSVVCEKFAGLRMMMVVKRQWNAKASRHNVRVVKAAVV